MRREDPRSILALAYNRHATVEIRRRRDELVGTDDQNIYGYAGASVKYLRRFEEDYKAKTVYLTQNYRSTGHIIDAANAWIARVSERMKAEHPIEIDRSRRRKPKGGDWESRDAVGRGRVQILRVRGDDRSQAIAALAELRRLAGLASDWDWRRCAVIARNWRYLGHVVGQLARNYRPPSDRCQARVHAIVSWDRLDGTPA